MVSASQCPTAMKPQALSLPTKTDGVELGQPRHRKRALIRALRLFLITGTCMYRGHEYTAERVSGLAPRETLEYVHAQLGRTSRGHLYLPWIRSNDHEKAGGTLTRRARVTNKGKTSSTIQVWSYNCESCLVPGRMSELLYTAKCRGADAVCLQGTQMTMETPWTHGQWYVTPVARTTHRAADGVIIAVSLQRFSKESIVTHHVWQPGRLLGVRVKAGQGVQKLTRTSPADTHQRKCHQPMFVRSSGITSIGCCARCPRGPESSWP